MDDHVYRCRCYSFNFLGIIPVAGLALGSFSVDDGCTSGDALVGSAYYKPQRPEIGSYQNSSTNCRVSTFVSEEGTQEIVTPER